ncbi:unnamed protein product, partial [marine sediment metagenome]
LGSSTLSSYPGRGSFTSGFRECGKAFKCLCSEVKWENEFHPRRVIVYIYLEAIGEGKVVRVTKISVV